MLESLINGIAVMLFIVGMFFFKLSQRRIHYGKIMLVCLALVLIPLSTFINSYLQYALQLVLLTALAHFSYTYYRRGLFRRRKELHELYVENRKEHRHARKMLYPHLKHIDERERKLEKERKKLDKARKDLEDAASRIKQEKKELTEERKELKQARFQKLSDKEAEE